MHSSYESAKLNNNTDSEEDNNFEKKESILHTMSRNKKKLTSEYFKNIFKNDHKK
jgi:hypothetical protein